MRAQARGTVVAIFVLAGAIAIEGCSLLVDDDSLSGHAGDAGADTAATSPTADGAAAADGTTSAPDAAIGFCDSRPNLKICSDFEHGGDLTGWTVVQDVGTVSGPSGSPRALDIDVPATTTGTEASAGLEWTTVGIGSKLVATEVIEVVATPKEVDQDMQTVIATVRNQSGAWYETHVVITATRQVVFEEASSSGSAAAHPLGLTLTPGAHRISLTTYFQTGGPRVDVQLDDAPAIGVPVAPNVANPTSTSASFGVAYLEGAQSGWKARLRAASVELAPN